MVVKTILTGYINSALTNAEYEKLEDGTFCGRIPKCEGVIAFSNSLADCRNEIQSILEDWIFVGLKMGHHLPVIDGFDLNKTPDYKPMAAM